MVRKVISYRKGKMTKSGAKRLRGARLSIGRSLLNYNNMIHYHKVCYYTTSTIDVTTTSNPHFWIEDRTNFYGSIGQYFTLAMLPNALEFVSLYDVYKILKIRLEIYPPFNVNQSSQVTQDTATQLTAAASMPGIHSVIDYNDVTIPNPATVTFQNATNALLQYATYRYTRGGKSHVRSFRPKYQIASMVSGTSTNIGEDKSRWLNTNGGTDAAPVASALPHYGLKIISDPVESGSLPEATSIIPFPVKVTYYLAFKNTK